MLVLGAPTESDKPDPSTFRAFRVNAGDGAIIHLGAFEIPAVFRFAIHTIACARPVIAFAGTWHDFPKAITNPVVVITMNSEEVVDALAKAGSARPMGESHTYQRWFLSVACRIPDCVAANPVDI